MGRSAQGVRILSIDRPDFVIGVDRIVKEDDAGESDSITVQEAPEEPSGEDQE
jgi:DNA gyrase subunit A